jgi:hypothetical protein
MIPRKASPVRISLSQSNIESNYQGFSDLAALAADTDKGLFETFEIDMSRVKFLAGNMCSPLGAVLHRASENHNSVKIIDLQPQVEGILARNGFLRNYGYPNRMDRYGTTIEYSRLEPGDDRYFGEYIAKHLVGKGIPEMSPRLTKNFRKNILEIFSNATIHSRTTMGVFACGQSFPGNQQLDFCITDLGIGFKKNIKDQVGLDLAPEDAIEWALAANHTTKRGSIPGGMGLKLLREFIGLNKGRIQIVSAEGYWEQPGSGEPFKKRLPKSFPGTAVNIEIDTSDTKSYCFESELNPDQIF